MFGKELFIRFTVRVFCERYSVHVYASFPFGFEVEMRNLVELHPDHCISFYVSLSLTALALSVVSEDIRPLAVCAFSTGLGTISHQFDLQ